MLPVVSPMAIALANSAIFRTIVLNIITPGIVAAASDAAITALKRERNANSGHTDRAIFQSWKQVESLCSDQLRNNGRVHSS